MDGGEHRRMVRCAGAHDKTVLNQVMLRFRPIAPKLGDRAGSDQLSLLKNKSYLVSSTRRKRKYVRVSKNNKSKPQSKQPKICPLSSPPSDHDRGKKSEREQEGDDINSVVTLQLLPERSDELKKSAEEEGLWCNKENDNDTNENNCCENAIGLKLKQPALDLPENSPSAAVSHKKVVLESWVTLECVTETACMEESGGEGLGCTDMERVKSLEEDKRPGLVSDSWNTVRWVNGAYKKMVMMGLMVSEESEREMEICVWLLTKEKLTPFVYCSSFTCWVRLQYYLALERGNKLCSQMVPCDVWRMDCGGFVWRLDVEAALGLGR